MGEPVNPVLQFSYCVIDEVVKETQMNRVYVECKSESFRFDYSRVFFRELPACFNFTVFFLAYDYAAIEYPSELFTVEFTS